MWLDIINTTVHSLPFSLVRTDCETVFQMFDSIPYVGSSDGYLRTKETSEMDIYSCVPRAVFEPNTSVFRWTEALPFLDIPATVMGAFNLI